MTDLRLTPGPFTSTSANNDHKVISAHTGQVKLLSELVQNGASITEFAPGHYSVTFPEKDGVGSISGIWRTV